MRKLSPEYFAFAKRRIRAMLPPDRAEAIALVKDVIACGPVTAEEIPGVTENIDDAAEAVMAIWEAVRRDLTERAS